MDNGIVIMMLGISLLLGASAMFGVMWAIKNGQFDDKDKMMDSVLNDGEDALNEAAEKERRKKEYKAK
ncbi:cbb3-type cytochrome oxidase assembly protein CcoS [Sulfurimonas sp. MAG313]|nr:cbb3-type cytochrome oxidase assembly protein CcoS [Sulfurimonas sp. MAG313]MDF1880812.1 cbb3-type cytochrome oxidase assembly protein CcoS [Sulfurimonas sp. MAG313]